MRGHNSTIIRKKKQLACGCYGYAFSGNMCKDHATVKSTKKRESKFEGEMADESLKNLIEDLDAVFSKYIRLKYADENGMVKCYTCPTVERVEEMQNGHFIGRINLSTRFLEQNCRPQCGMCNMVKKGNLEKFEENLRSEDDSLPQWLKEQGMAVENPTRGDIKGLINGYRFKIKILQSKLKK